MRKINNKLRILLVEDDHVISNFISEILKANGYHVIMAETGGEACSMATSHCPDLVLLDLGLPDMDGLEVIRMIREWTDMPIVIVSARGHEREKVEALDLGADDYVTKPFGTPELLARIRTAIRHSHKNKTAQQLKTDKITIEDLRVDYRKRKVTLDGEEIHLTPIEYKIMVLLSQYAGRVLTYDFIIKQIWGPYTSESQILRVNMANIRRKIEANPAEPKYILTEVGVGYRMIEGKQ